MNYRRVRNSAYTLTELLIVIGIIAIITAILIPVFFSVRANARQSICLNNVRQVGLGVMLYQQDYDEVFPPYFDTVIGNRCTGNVVYSGAGKYWTEIVSPYIQKVRQKDAAKANTQARLEDLPAVYLCPESSNNPTQPQNYQPGNLSGYGISDHIVNWWTPDHCGPFLSRAAPAVVRPAQCLLLVETFDWFSPKHDRPGAALALSPLDKLSQKINGATGTIDGRHESRFRKTKAEQAADPFALNTVFFCDGHVKSTRVRDLVGTANLWSLSGNGTWP